MKRLLLAILFYMSGHTMAANVNQDGCDISTVEKERYCSLARYKREFGDDYANDLLSVVSDLQVKCGSFPVNALSFPLIAESPLFEKKRINESLGYKKRLHSFSCKSFLKTLWGGEEKLKSIFYDTVRDYSPDKALSLAQVEKDVARQCGKKLLLNEVVTLSDSDLLSAYLDKRFADYQAELSGFQCAGFGY